jgi:hypothetical protein
MVIFGGFDPGLNLGPVGSRHVVKNCSGCWGEQNKPSLSILCPSYGHFDPFSVIFKANKNFSLIL